MQLAGKRIAISNWTYNRWICFTALEAMSTVSMTAGSSAPAIKLLYSTDLKSWLPFVVGQTTVTLEDVGDVVYIRAWHGGNVCLANGASNSSLANMFSLTGKVDVSGDITALLDPY